MLLLGKRIKETRIKAGLTQKELGNLVNVTKVSICGYENNTRTPTIDTLMELARVLKVDVSYLVGEDNFIIAETDSEYQLAMAKEEIDFIKEIRKHDILHSKVLDDPKRTADLIIKKLR